MSQGPKQRFHFYMPEVVLKLLFTRQLEERTCDHLNLIKITQPETDVCQECVSLGDSWPSLRMCLICGYVGCCDTSKNKHMLSHIQASGHPIIRSIERGEAWIWCYSDDAFISSRSPQVRSILPNYPRLDDEVG